MKFRDGPAALPGRGFELFQIFFPCAQRIPTRVKLLRLKKLKKHEDCSSSDGKITARNASFTRLLQHMKPLTDC